MDVFVALELKLVEQLFGARAVTFKGESYRHGRHLLVALRRGVMGDILGYFIGVVPSRFLVATCSDACQRHHVFQFQLVQGHDIAHVTACIA